MWRAKTPGLQQWAQVLATLGIVSRSLNCPQSHAEGSPQSGSMLGALLPSPLSLHGQLISLVWILLQATAHRVPAHVQSSLLSELTPEACQAFMVCDRTVAQEEESCSSRGALGLWVLVVGIHQGL